jgi:hypothetical protein
MSGKEGPLALDENKRKRKRKRKMKRKEKGKKKHCDLMDKSTPQTVVVSPIQPRKRLQGTSTRMKHTRCRTYINQLTPPP